MTWRPRSADLSSGLPTADERRVGMPQASIVSRWLEAVTTAIEKPSKKRMPLFENPRIRNRRKRWPIALMSLALASVSLAQIRGPITPGRRRPPRPPPSLAAEVVLLSGTLVKVRGSYFVLETNDRGEVRVVVTSGTRFLLEDRVISVETIRAGDDVRVQASEESSEVFKALQVVLDIGSLTKPAPGLPREEVIPRRPPHPGDDEDEGPPKLLRRKPGQSGESESQQDSSSTLGGPPPGVAGDPFIERTRKWVFNYSQDLPNFVCHEVITRMAKAGRRTAWQTLDVVEADLVYEDNRESYHNIEIDGRPIHKKMDQIEGSWSMGEFASTLLDIFVPQSQTKFRFDRASRPSGVPVHIYQFEVAKANSAWRVNAEGASVSPAYKGTLWIDPQTARVRRIEIQAVDLPLDFGLDTVETTVDYDEVSIGGNEHLLPIESENLGCWRGTNRCARNKVQFRDYRKFSTESTVVTTDSTIDYDGTSPARE